MDTMELDSKIKIYTSYFAINRGITNGVCIAIGAPWWRGERYFRLCPTKELLDWWKRVDDTKENRQLYESIYREKVLSKLDVDEVAKELDGKVLLCFEKSDSFCHRHIIAKWFRENGYCCEEINEKL